MKASQLGLSNRTLDVRQRTKRNEDYDKNFTFEQSRCHVLRTEVSTIVCSPFPNGARVQCLMSCVVSLFDRGSSTLPNPSIHSCGLGASRYGL